MIACGMALAHMTQNGAAHPKIQRTKVSDRRDREHPNPVRFIAEPVDQKRRKKKSHGHCGRGGQPVRENVSCDVADAQLQRSLQRQANLTGGRERGSRELAQYIGATVAGRDHCLRLRYNGRGVRFP